jgi:hypothetical protein
MMMTAPSIGIEHNIIVREREEEKIKIVNWQVNTALFLSFKNYLKLSSSINRTSE